MSAVHQFLNTSAGFKDMSNLEGAANVVLSPYHYLFNGVQVDIWEQTEVSEPLVQRSSSGRLSIVQGKTLKVSHSPVWGNSSNENPVTEKLKTLARTFFSLIFVIPAIVIGGALKLAGRYSKPHPYEDQVTPQLEQNYRLAGSAKCRGSSSITVTA